MATVTGNFPTSTMCPLLKTIRSFGFLSMENGPWVAGGAVRRLLCDEPLGDADIDIFLSSQPNAVCQSTKVGAAFGGRGDNLASERCVINGVTDFRLAKRDGAHSVRIQMITNRTFESATALIDDFDLTVCMAATDGWSWMADQKFFDHTRDKLMVLNNGEQRRNNARRISKYCHYGFTPVPGTFGKLIGLDDGTLLKKLENNNGELRHASSY